MTLMLRVHTILFGWIGEIYPTRIRALGTSIATAWLRAGSAAGPILVGFMLTRFNLGAVFLLFALVSLVGSVAAGVFSIETRERILQEISQWPNRWDVAYF